ncbi:hypothetical protein JCM33374_g2951 [Metschnikowia sp. JCM 33374]|nr:hypothetical protein JCM33374_g2951 [Metschnikowia sp. JCM 33374]
MKFVLVNSNPDTIREFGKGFDPLNHDSRDHTFECFQGNLQQYQHQYQEMSTSSSANAKVAVVAPTNSLAFMGGGFDRAIADLFTGPHHEYTVFQEIVQNHTLEKFNGFIPPQTAHVVDLKEAYAAAATAFPENFITHLIQTPTMAVPENISATCVFYCMWNTLLAANGKFDTVIFPAIGAGYGGVPVPIVARAICGAFGIFYMQMKVPVSRGAAILLFLNKDYKALGNAADIAKIESIIASGGKGGLDKHTQNDETPKCSEMPLDWWVFSRCLNSLG